MGYLALVSVDPPEAEKERVAMQLTRKIHSAPNGIKIVVTHW